MTRLFQPIAPGVDRAGGVAPHRRGSGGSGVEIGVVEDGEVEDDLVRDMTEVLTSFCARLYGRRSAARRAEKALQAATV